MATVEANGIKIGYERHGTGEPLLLIPGLGYSRWMWHRMIPGLAAAFDVIALDNRGVGESAKPAGPYTAQLLAADAVGLLDALGVDRAHVLGHSMGGFVAQALALDFPERLRRLVLSATNFGGPNHVPVTPEAMAILSDTSGDPLERLRRGIGVSTAADFLEREPELVQAWLAHRAQNPIDPAGYQAQMGVGLSLMSPATAFEEQLSAVEAETLILSGAEDRVVPPANAELLAGKIPHSTVRIVEGAGHFYPLERPDQAVEIITTFLAG